MFRTALTLAFLAALATATVYQDCGSTASDVIFVVDDCEVPPCVVVRGTSFQLNITFTADHEIIFLNTSVTAVIAGVEVPWPGFDNDGCANLIEGESCPLPSGSPSTWEYDVDVLAEYPVIDTLVTVKLFDDETGEEHDEVCLQVPVTII